jgi:hypothetical protein
MEFRASRAHFGYRASMERDLAKYRLSRRSNRQLNHAIHLAAVSLISHRGSEVRRSR